MRNYFLKQWQLKTIQTIPPPAAATVAGEAPAKRSWFCREKSMLYHSAVLSTGLGGITRLGFSLTSRTYEQH